MEVADRINKKMMELSLSQADLIRATGAGRATVSGWVNGTNKPSAKHIGALAKALKTSEWWILYGVNAPIQFEEVTAWDDSTPLEDDEIAVPFFKDFSFACGSGSIGEAMLNERRRLRISKATLRNLGIQPNKTCASLASGNSMSPTINDGDTVHIDTNRTTIKDGKVFALCHGGLFLIKRLYNLPMGGVRIVSDNAVEFPEVHLTAQEIQEQQFEVLGWVWQVSSLDFW